MSGTEAAAPPTQAPAGPPAPPWWPAPVAPLPSATLAVAALGGLVAALTLPGTRAGAPLTLLLLIAVVLCAWASRTRDPLPGDRRALGLAALLALVPVVRAEALLVVLCVLASGLLLALVALRRDRWSGVLLLAVLVPWAVGLGARHVVRHPPVRLPAGDRAVRRAALAAWTRGAAVAAVVTTALVVLLASADAAVARLLGGWRLPDLPVPRLLLGVLVAAVLVGLVSAAVLPPRPDRVREPRGHRAADWALPLVLADVVVLGYLLVQGAVLFDPATALEGTGTTPAQWARQGFGQLVAVSVLLLLVLGRAARRVDRSRRRDLRLLHTAGGLLALCVLSVVASALVRMALYTERFGLTALRLYVVAFELGLAVALVAACLLWWRRRRGPSARAVVLGGAAVLVALAALGPEATAARYDVERWDRYGDALYVMGLSADAAPALARLQDDVRGCVVRPLATAAPDPWYGWNLSRWRADRLLARVLLPQAGECPVP
ncbi:DUF4153 domain-containing protein [Aquipuribacter nitratireducens]|uniref:DUF4153 domain-containing protein n=1 Tax=Aquipuribacter nitratireducens TaxID=650104 RepID=A0ABW0GNF3_9MICO